MMVFPVTSDPIALRSRLLRGFVCFIAGLSLQLIPLSLVAQDGGVHFLHDSLTVPGSVGGVRLRQGGPVHGYYQPVKISAPEGAVVSFAADGTFTDPFSTPVEAGLLISPIYRLKVSNIPNFPEHELFPTIEVVDRLYPPAGERGRFPIPVDISQEDLELALDGKLVTRVIYLEDPQQALPVAAGEERHWFDAGAKANPLEVADRFGRPMAILRIGGRSPDDRDGPDMHFLGGCPPFTIWKTASDLPPNQAEVIPDVDFPSENNARYARPLPLKDRSSR